MTLLFAQFPSNSPYYRETVFYGKTNDKCGGVRIVSPEEHEVWKKLNSHHKWYYPSWYTPNHEILHSDWNCPICTFINSGLSCAMCGYIKSS